MCIIAHKPIGVAFPTKRTLKTCFQNNPDGAGFMYASDGQVYIHKGYMSFNAFWQALRNARKRTGDNTAYTLHFRITTQGGNRPDCTHPFPLSRNMDDLRQLDTTAAIGVAHNGIIHLTANNAKNITHSDTMEFITDYLALIIHSKDYHKNADTLLLIDRLCGSRLAIMDGKGHTELTGRGWVEHGGVWYSNDTFMDYTQLWDYYENSRAIDYNPDNCPLVVYGDDSFCYDCKHFDQCYSIG